MIFNVVTCCKHSLRSELNCWMDFIIKIIHFWCDLQCCHMLQAFTLKWTQLLNGFLVKIIHFWCDLQCCHMLQAFTSKWTQLLNELVVKIIHFWCDLQCCHVLQTFTSKWTQLLNGLVSKNYSFLMWSSMLSRSCTHSLRSELNCWMDCW